MCLNASLAGLVGITASCDVTDCAGAIAVGVVSGLLVVFGVWLLGMCAVIAWTAVTITIAFLIIRATVGLRVSEQEEIIGLDATEHGLPSAYAGFSIMDIANTMTMEVNENTVLGNDDYVGASEAQKAAAVKVVRAPETGSGIYKVSIISRWSASLRPPRKRSTPDISATAKSLSTTWIK